MRSSVSSDADANGENSRRMQMHAGVSGWSRATTPAANSTAVIGSAWRARRTRGRTHFACKALFVIVTIIFITSISGLLREYGQEIVYYFAVPLWLRNILEVAPKEVTPARSSSSGGPPVEGARRVGNFWVSTLSTRPNITLVHNFMSDEECDEILLLGESIGLKGNSKSSSVSNVHGGITGLSAAIVDSVYRLANSGNGIFISEASINEANRSLTDIALDRMYRIMHRTEMLTSTPMSAMEDPFLQHYSPGQSFWAHYDLYDVRTWNKRSATLLAYLEDTEHGGETEFMKVPLLVRPRKGTALIFSDCVLQDVPAVDTREAGNRWEDNRGDCRAGWINGQMSTLVEQQEGEHVQRPCCVGRDTRSIHQGRPVLRGSTKTTLTIWLHQRFTQYGIARYETFEKFKAGLLNPGAANSTLLQSLSSNSVSR